MTVSNIRPDNKGGLETISIVLNGKMTVVFSQITMTSMQISFANASGQMYSFNLYRCDGEAAPTAEGRAVPVQGPPRSQEAATIQALAMQMTRRLEQGYWRTSVATLLPSDVAMLCNPSSPDLSTGGSALCTGSGHPASHRSDAQVLCGSRIPGAIDHLHQSCSLKLRLDVQDLRLSQADRLETFLKSSYLLDGASRRPRNMFKSTTHQNLSSNPGILRRGNGF